MVESRTSTRGRAELGWTSRFARRWLSTWTSRVAAFVLAAFVTSALFAPLLANSRPLWLRAVDLGRHEGARTSLVPVTTEWVELVRVGESAWAAQHPGRPPGSFEALLRAQRTAVDVRVRSLRESISGTEASVLDEFERRLDDVHGPEDLARVVPAAARASEALVPRQAGASAGVTLRSRASSPLLASWEPLDAAAALAWLAFLVALACRMAARNIAWATGIVSLLVVVSWRSVVGDAPVVPSHKSAIASGDMIVEQATFAWIPYGPAETNLSESYRAPTWLGASPAATKPSPPGFEAAPLAVRVLPGEPAADSRWRHLLGTDSVGRDLLSRLLWGARASLFAGFLSALILTGLGIAIGAWAGWRGGLVDLAWSRVIEVVLCFPAFVLVLCAVFFVDPRIVSPLVAVAVVIGFVGWPHVARLVRAECLRLRELEFVSAARALGLPERTILWRHVLPNALPPAILAFAFAVGSGVLAESALSFLGFSGQADQPSWGALVADSRSPDHAWIWIFPGACIFALVASTNFLGEALRDALDPRHER